ncbi:FlxA-like family protein [Salidesulfovibrio brasiliensis]|uniref:FlxA-like family protein n=1 Tax=Salidesulfovibrio brasiliensis TaxID=221711 RepID=UPI0006D2AC0C|nr:FlxA-like family protein [Salidesulfovibrio brasiliensis]
MKIESGLTSLSQLGGNGKGFELSGKEDNESGGLAINKGDTLSISPEAKALAAEKAGESGSGGSTPEEQLIERLKDRIEQLKREIDEIKQSNLPEEQKQKEIQAKESEIAQLNAQISELQGGGKGPVAGGTPAKGFGNSLT